MSVKITELPILDSLADNDIVAGVDVSGNVTSKIEMSTLKNYIDTNTQYTAGTNIDITNNVISAPDVYNKDEMNNQIEELQSEVDSLSTIFNAFPTESGEGESLTLDDTAEVTFKKFDLQGNTSQQTYTGKQLFDIETISASNRQYKRNNGFILTKGTNRTIQFNLPNSIPAGTYTLSVKVINSTLSSNSKFLVNLNGSGSTILGNIEILNNPTFTITSPVDNLYFFITSSESDGVTITIDDIMLNSGNTAQPYEPYVGGIPSPNPNYPQDIHVVSGDNEIVVTSKNRLGYPSFSSVTFGNVTFTNNKGVYTISTNGTSSATYTNNYDIPKYVIKEGDYIHYNNDFIDGHIGYTLLFSNGTNYFTSFSSTTNKKVSLSQHIGKTIIGMRFNFNSNYTINGTCSPMIVNSSTAIPFEEYVGNTYNIDLPVENLFDKDNANVLYASFSGEKTINSSPNAKTIWIACKPNTTYTISKVQSARFRIATSTLQPAIGVSTLSFTYDDSATSLTITTESNANYLLVYYFLNGTDTLTEQQILDSIQIELGSKANSYTPYGTTPIELCKIGNYQDYFYKDSDKWYLHKEIGKYTFTGSETWNIFNSNSSRVAFRTNISDIEGYTNGNSTPNLLSNYFIPISYNGSWVVGKLSRLIDGGAQTALILIYSPNTSVEDLRAWLNAHNTTVYYVLATPTTEPVTYQPLIDQLNLLEKAMSKEGQTNISQVNNDKPFIIKAEAIQDLSSVLDRVTLLES